MFSFFCYFHPLFFSLRFKIMNIVKQHFLPQQTDEKGGLQAPWNRLLLCLVQAPTLCSPYWIQIIHPELQFLAQKYFTPPLRFEPEQELQIKQQNILIGKNIIYMQSFFIYFFLIMICFTQKNRSNKFHQISYEKKVNMCTVP